MDNNNNFKNFFKKNIFPISIISTVVILLAGSLYFSYVDLKSYENNLVQEEELYQAVDKTDVKSFTETTTLSMSETKEEETETTTEKIVQNTETTEISTETTTNIDENTETNTDDATSFNMFDDSSQMIWPVEGQIVMDYSIETGIFDKTLQLYRTNDSISISAEEGTNVLAAFAGIVEDIYTDNEKGNTIVINHGNGWKSTYSQLQEDINVTVGQVVKEGDVIGTVALPTNYSVYLGPHLDFKVTKDDVSKDPKLLLAQIE